MFRIGLGKDIHPLVTGRPFILGGQKIPFEKGQSGHSDGDALTHAVIDALLGASGLGDIGEFFPSEDPKWKDADSLELLRTAWGIVQRQGWSIVNLDCVVCCENPKILPFREKIRQSLAGILGISFETIFVKGKTGEGLGPVGNGEAIEALVICLMEKE
jgi:2-C-methyl-D-erythritol 2,4-cyclodiphosphate synthase